MTGRAYGVIEHNNLKGKPLPAISGKVMRDDP